METIRFFSKLDKNVVKIAGGKGASLGEMTRKGLPVPPGFVILAKAFDDFLAATDLNVEIDALVHQVTTAEMHTVEEASAKIKALVLGAKMPTKLAKDILEAYDQLNAKFVAVRSSATAEDSAAAAWAGQLESYLNTTKKNLLINVQKCWASLFTPRAIFYRFEKNLHAKPISVAVVVQKMVASEASGVAFSVHPVTEDYNQLIIEASYGLGEAIVSGSVTPDSYVIEKKSRRIIDKNVATQTKGLYRDSKGGNVWRKIPLAKGSKQVLTDKEILALTQIILAVEKHYGFPCDIEWAKEKGKFYVLQSRPITTLKKQLNNKNQALKKRKTKQRTKLEWSKIVERQETVLIIDYLVRGLTKKNTKKVLGLNSGFENYLYFKNEIFWQEDELNKIRKYLKQVIEQESYSYLKKLVNKWINIGQDLKNRALFLAQKKEKGMSHTTLLKYFRDFSKLNWRLSTALLLPIALEKELTASLEKILNEKKIDDKKRQEYFTALTMPAKENTSSEEINDFYRLASLTQKEVKRKKKKWNSRNLLAILETSALKKTITTYLNNYAWIGARWYRGPGWKVKDLAKRLSSLKPNENYAQKAREIVNFRKSLQRKSEDMITKLKLTAKEKELINVIKEFVYLRTYRTDIFNQAGFIVRPLLRQIAKLIGITYEQLIFLTASEISYLLAKKEKVSASKKKQIRERENNFAALLENGEVNIFAGQKNLANLCERLNLPVTEKAAATEIFRGFSAYPGKVSGRVKIIKDLQKEASHFKKGDVLVTAMTTPDFMVILDLAAAIITDEGGILCHAAIVSRELQKPCVIGTKNATALLVDGMKVKVDANLGKVEILK